MRRLFSTFAGGWPGAGLLLLRLVAGISVFAIGVEKFQAGDTGLSSILDLLAWGDSMLLVVGLWTPIAGSLLVALAAAQILVRHENPYPGLLLAAIGAALALVGPGAISVDAWLFGWKRIDIGR